MKALGVAAALEASAQLRLVARAPAACHPAPLLKGYP
jgi:hypothetical protein